MVSVSAHYRDKQVEIDKNGDIISATIPYIVNGVGSPDEALTETLSNSPSVYGAAARASISIDRRLTPTEYIVSVRYATVASDGPGNGTITPASIPRPTASFSTTGGTQKVFVGKNTSPWYPSSAPYMGNVIGWDGEKANGIDVPSSVFNFQETHYFPRSMITNRWKAKIAKLTAKVNKTAFRSFESLEVLFLGCEGAERANSSSGDDDYLVEIQFKFAHSENLYNLTVGQITGITKYGWWYLDVINSPQMDTVANILISKPKYAYVHEIFDEANFALLGIGA